MELLPIQIQDRINPSEFTSKYYDAKLDHEEKVVDKIRQLQKPLQNQPFLKEVILFINSRIITFLTKQQDHSKTGFRNDRMINMIKNIA